MKICCVPTEKLPARWISNTCSLPEDFFAQVRGEDLSWIERREAEINSAYKQLIPYAVFQNPEGLLLCYPRQGGEKRLHGLFSCGIGGHVDQGDQGADIFETISRGIQRELSEEISNFDPASVNLEYRGIINDADTPVGQVHLGLVYLAQCAPGFEPAAGDELKGMAWKSREDLALLPKESWADLAFKLL